MPESLQEARELDHARLAQLDLNGGRVLIEAGAGTGKTYTLASLYLKQVLEGHTPRNIGAITFTNAATEELRGRLRQRLAAARRGLEGEEAPRQEPWWLLVGQACEREGEACVRQRLLEALAGMDEAPVHTIHGFCLQLLRRHPGASALEPVLEADADDGLLQAARDFWRRYLTDDTRAFRALAAVKIETPENLYQTLRGLVARQPLPWPETDPAPPDIVNLEQQLDRLRRDVQQALEQEAEILIEGLRAQQDKLSRTYYRPQKPPWWEKLRLELADWQQDPADFPEPLGKSKLDKGIKKAYRAELGEWLGRFRLPALADAWNGQREKLKQAYIAYGHALLARALEELPQQAAGLRNARGSLTPDDLLRLCAEALEGAGGEILAARVAQDMPLLMVDEFQDTDALQYRILRALESAGTRLVLIGDPKQAIYAFRGADVHTYLAAREACAPDRRFRLTRNHRSRATLCAAVNRLFEGPCPFAWRGLEHPPAVAARDASGPLRLPAGLDPAPEAGLTLWPVGGPDEACLPSAQQARQNCATAAARHIAALLQAGREGTARIGARAVAAPDIAVLVTDHQQARTLRDALAAWRIPSACTSRDSVFESEAAQSLYKWVAALAEPAQPARLRVALADPLGGLDLAGLRRALDEDWEDWLQAAADLHALWRRHGVLAMIQRLLEKLGPATLACRENGERLLTDLLHLAELLQTAAARHPEPAALTRWLSQQIEHPGTSEEHILRLESERDAVRILTVHKAKGLQFPLVYLPFLWRFGPDSRRNAPHHFHHQGRWRVCFDKHNTEAVRLATREQLSEQLRLLYVALTRAETKLFAWAGPVGQDAGRSAFDWILHPPVREAVVTGRETFRCGDFRKDRKAATLADWYQRLRALAGPAIAVADAPPQARASVAPPPVAQDLCAAPCPPPPHDPWRITSYSGILRGEHRTLDYDADEEDIAPWPGIGRELFPPGAATGNFLHRLLEETDYTAPDWEARRAHIEQLRLRFGLPADERWWPALTHWMDQVLASPLPEQARLADIAFGDRLHEAGFHFRIRGARERDLNALLQRHDMAPLEQWVAGRRGNACLAGLLTGAIDLVYRHGGRYYIADFKSNLLPDYAPGRLRQAMLERRYDLQYLLYALALHRHLALRLPDYDYDRHFGGVRYLFLRGMSPRHPGQGVFAICPPRDLIEAFDTLLEGGRP
ncbi:MAG TPA: exodeoxyribonuclease V subunit beta [Gammaproteobacteria bacterium]|nr:exodeoxyribonuclease V subunit beta [Gammaproteobacteria bacterium]